MDTVPGGVTLDAEGRPTDCNGKRLDPLPDSLSDEQKSEANEAGIVAQKQADFYTESELRKHFGLSKKTAEALKGPDDLFDQTEGVEATSAAEDLAEDEGLDLSTVQGTGKDEKILKGDVQDALE